MTHRQITLTLTVTVPAKTTDEAVETAINVALDEPPCDWGQWTVGRAIVGPTRARELERAAEALLLAWDVGGDYEPDIDDEMRALERVLRRGP